MDAKAIQDDLQSLGFTPSLAKAKIGKEVGSGGGRESASDGATGRSVEAFQFGEIGSA